MEAGGKDCEEETLQTAFKKLRVDAESLPAVVNVSEALGPRAVPRVCAEASGAKSKHNCPKDNWHGCMRKASRGASRTQRRRRSKSPILHPPKFTYCGSSSNSSTTASSLSPPCGHLKHQCLAVPEAVETCAGGGRAPSTLAVPAQKELLSSGAPGHMSPPVFGASAGYEPSIRAGARGVSVVASSSSCQEIPAITTTTTTKSRQVGGLGQAQSDEGTSPEKVACDGAECGAAVLGIPGVAGGASDFQALSKLHSSSSGGGGLCPCSCCQRESPEPGEGQGEGQGRDAGSPCQCQSRCQSGLPGWKGVEVYSFTGLRDIISECERNLPGNEDAGHTGLSPPGPRTLNSANNNTTTATSPSTSLSSSSSGSPRSCSEQARAYVDDITIEDLSGYMEYYLYIPKKMSHMAEMMYT